MATEPIHVLLGDKNPLLLSALQDLLGGDARFGRVVAASDSDRLIDAVDRFRFDVAVIGWVFPPSGALDLLTQLRDRPGAPRTVVYTGDPNPEIPAIAMREGAAAFYPKRQPAEGLVDVMVAVANGEMRFPFVDVRRTSQDPLAALTARERVVLAAVATGATSREMANELLVSPNTVKFHLRNIYGKLGVRNRAEAVGIFLRGK